MKVGQRLVHYRYGKGVVANIVNLYELPSPKVYYIIKFDESCSTLGISKTLISLIENLKPSLQDKYRGFNFMAIDSECLEFYITDLLMESDEHFKIRNLKEKFGEDYEKYMEYLEG